MEEKASMPKTMFEKIWDAHIVRDIPGESTILYIDRHLVHEMTSPQASPDCGPQGFQCTGPTPLLPSSIITYPPYRDGVCSTSSIKTAPYASPPCSRMHETSASPCSIWPTHVRALCIS